MTLSTGYQLATDAQFREVGNFSAPPRAGRITAVEASGQVRVETDDPEGGDVLAWPLNGFTYGVGDVVYVAFALNNPESALVIGSKGTTPALDAGVLPEAYVPVDGSDPLTGDWDIGEDRRILAEALRARDAEGLKLEDDAGNLGLFVADGGGVAIGSGTAQGQLRVYRNVAAAGTDAPVANIHQDNAGDDQAALSVQQDGSGHGVQIVAGAAPGSNVPGGFGQIISGTTSKNRSAWADGDKVTYLNTFGSLGFGEISTFDYGVGAGFALLLNANGGNIGSGTLSPQGKLHLHDGTAGLLFVSKTGIGGSAQTILPNAAGDVTRALFGMFVLSDGSTGVGDTFMLSPGGSEDIVIGGGTWRLALNANGALTVVRQSGSGTASIALLMVWI